MSAYPPVAFPPPPPTSNTLSSQRRAALVRSSKKLSKVLGDVPRLLDDIPPLSSLEPTATSLNCNTESTWRKRKPTHLPPLLKLPTPSIDVPLDSPNSPVCFSPPACRDSVISVAPAAPSSASATSTQRRTKLERLRRKLGQEVPATAVFPTTPHTGVPTTPHKPKTSKSRSPHARSRSVARLPSQADDARSVTFSISSDESVHTVRLTAAHVHSPRPHKAKHVYQTGPIPPVPSIPAHFEYVYETGPPAPAHLAGSKSSSRHATNNDEDDEDVGLLRPRQKMPAGSMIGGSDFKAAQRAVREGKVKHGMADPTELIDMVGFLPF